MSLKQLPAELRPREKLIARGAGAEDVEAMALAFVKVAERMRGLVAWVEKPGKIDAGADVIARLPEQWIYTPTT